MEKLQIQTNLSRIEMKKTDNELRVKRLIKQIKNKDQNAFSEIVKLYRNQVASLAFKMVNDYDEAADITQNVFVKMNNNIWRYDEKKKFYTWLHRITVNASIDYIRKHKRHRHEQIDNLNNSIESKMVTPDLCYGRKKIRSFINNAADNLNEKQKSAFVLRDIKGCKIDDVANIMNMPEATVRWYLHRARTLIKKDLLKKCPQLLLLLGIS